ncbi:MAG TPA: LysR family transcriptional regulator [Candidatus Angelobacter sp.]|nr:LysR family transcriptional regulator [Candidatus Angelobacter sp.]
MSVPFELHQLEAFIVVADHSSFVQGAKQLHIAQPALTRKIHELEKRLGVQLFVRGHNTIWLTPAGRRFRMDAGYILHQVNLSAKVVGNLAQREG